MSLQPVSDPDAGKRSRRPPVVNRLRWLGWLFLIPAAWALWSAFSPSAPPFRGPVLGPLLIFLPQFVVTAIIGVVYHSAKRRAARRVRDADGRLCWRCMYDLSASPPQGVCPECGTIYDATELQQRWRTADW